MITFRNLGYKGRLGNQLYQLAATIGIARAEKTIPVLPANWLYRPYFSVPNSLYMDDIPAQAHEAAQFVHYMDPRCVDYLQDYSLFADVIDEIREYLQPSSLAQRELWKYTAWPHQCVGVHVRRGDNVYDPGVPNKSDYHLTAPLDYYQRGLKQFPKGLDVACFSDDVPWCQENIPASFYGMGKAYPKENESGYGQIQPTDWIDLFLMTRCDYFLIGGSTFGIWGAILSGVSPDRVVRPDVVYGPLLGYIDSELLFPSEWEILRCF